MSSKFHNKWHRFNHHTNPKPDPRYPDSSYDPIASPESPFQGAFVINGPLSANSSLSGFAASFASLSTALILDSNNYALSARGDINIVGDTTQLGNYNITGNTTQIGNTYQVGSVNIIGGLSATNGTITNDLVVYGNLSALGELSYLNTIVSVTSALSVVNAGSGPAVTVNQTGSQPVANFEDDGSTVLFIGDGGLVGINTDRPTVPLTVRGAISGFNVTTSFNTGSASGNFSFATGSGRALGDFSHAEGVSTTASGIASHAEGENTIATGEVSHAAGYRAEAAQNYTYAWTDGLLGTTIANISTTRSGQYMVSASGGVFVPGNVGIRTDNNSNALTVRGTLSATSGIISANTSTDGLRVTQTGTGNALVVEDSTNPDATPFVVTNVGSVGIGLTAPGEKLTVIGSISASGRITAVDGLSSENDLFIFNNKKLILGYSPAPAVNDGAELWMDYTNGNDAGELIISTRDNGNEPIVFRQRRDDIAPGWQREPLIIGSDSRIGVAAASGTRTFPAELTVYGNLSSASIAATNLSATTISLSAASTTLSMQLTTFVTPITATGEFILVNVNGRNRAIQLWQY